MSEHWTDRLSEYLDGELSPEQVTRLDAHVAGCADCAHTLDGLRTVVAEARALPTHKPTRDLWRGIAARLAPRASADPVVSVAPAAPVVSLDAERARRRRRVAFTVPQLLAASIALVMLSAGGALLWVARGGGSADAGMVTAAATSPVQLTAAYSATIDELENEFRARRTALDPQTVMVVERNLAIIDQAITDARLALEADPSSGFLHSHLASALRRKVDLLRQAAAIGRTES